jgi:hypothetical protein
MQLSCYYVCDDYLLFMRFPAINITFLLDICLCFVLETIAVCRLKGEWVGSRSRAFMGIWHLPFAFVFVHFRPIIAIIIVWNFAAFVKKIKTKSYAAKRYDRTIYLVDLQ